MKAPLLLSTSVLQLNRLWQPLKYRSIEYALTKLFNSGKEEPFLPVWIDIAPNGTLGSATRSMTIEEWMELPIDESQPFIRMTRNRRMRVPLVVITPSYAGFPNRTRLQLNKRGLFIRDKAHCGYCAKRITLDESTIDHILPRAQGGQHTWENTVLSCSPCNSKKGNQTPKQAKMPLLITPTKPQDRPQFEIAHEDSPLEHRLLLQ